MIVIQAGISPEYFLDKMQWYEVDEVLCNLAEKERESWEQTRLISYVIAQTNSTKRLKPTDIIKFRWDNEGKNTSVSKADMERLKKKTEAFLKSKQNG